LGVSWFVEGDAEGGGDAGGCVELAAVAVFDAVDGGWGDAGELGEGAHGQAAGVAGAVHAVAE
jgi:hypothetical protein